MPTLKFSRLIMIRNFKMGSLLMNVSREPIPKKNRKEHETHFANNSNNLSFIVQNT